MSKPSHEVRSGQVIFLLFVEAPKCQPRAVRLAPSYWARTWISQVEAVASDTTYLYALSPTATHVAGGAATWQTSSLLNGAPSVPDNTSSSTPEVRLHCAAHSYPRVSSRRRLLINVPATNKEERKKTLGEKRKKKNKKL